MDKYEAESKRLTPSATGNAESQKWFIEGEGISWNVLYEVENGTELVVADLSYPQARATKDAHNAAIERATHGLYYCDGNGFHEIKHKRSHAAQPKRSEQSWPDEPTAKALLKLEKQRSEQCPDCKEKLSGDEMLDREVHDRCQSQGQPQRNDQPSEWTPELEWRVTRLQSIIAHGGYEELSRTIINELAAERQITFEAQQAALKEGIRSGEMERKLVAEGQRADDSIIENVRLMNVLADERQRREQVFEQLTTSCMQRHELNQQLLSAQVAIEKHNKECSPECYRIDVDLFALKKHDEELLQQLLSAQSSAMQEHDAEVRKPLVDTLEQLRDECTPPTDKRELFEWTGKIFCNSVKKICDDALAKVKKK